MPCLIPGIRVLGLLVAQVGAPLGGEVRSWYYRDSSGLSVGTYAAAGRAEFLGGRVGIEARALADRVQIAPSRGLDPSRPGADRRAPDAVTSASATAGGGKLADKWRVEGVVGADLRWHPGGAPVSLGAIGRASRERDYDSTAAALRAAAELFQRNLTIGAALGYGKDHIEPVEVVAGEEHRWPATHERVTATLSASQIVDSRLLVVGGASTTSQRGELSSPYRRALIGPSLLVPERLPRSRDRTTVFLGLSAGVSDRIAIHLRQGAYADSWDVRALVPEATLAVEVADGVLVSGAYRLYLQGAATFHRASYQKPQDVMSGDPRLGPIREHALGADLRWRTGGAESGPMILAGYQVSRLDYRDAGRRVVAQVFWLGIGAAP